MKVLTNIRFYTVAGIAQYLSNFIRHNERDSSSSLFLHGVDIMRPDEKQNIPFALIQSARRFKLITRCVDSPQIADVIKTAPNLDHVRSTYEPIIQAYLSAIEQVQPDVILINGTFYLPWCLLQAATRYNKARIIVHYHGVLKKEVEHWKEELAKQRFLEMERDFDRPNITYVFPSNHARQTAENEVFGHVLQHAVVLPNPTPEAFFQKPQGIRERTIGMVSRWTRVKNPSFLISLARHNRKTRAGYHIRAISDLEKDTLSYKKASSIISFSPPVDNAQLPSFYRRLGVLIMPSHFETYGNVAQEALAMNTPVLVSENSWFADTLRELELDRWVMDFSSPAAILERIEEIIATGVPHAAWEQLRERYSDTPIFNAYSRILLDS